MLNIDSIFNRERRRQAGYSPLGGECGEVQEERAASVSSSCGHRGGGDEEGGAEAPPPAPARLIQRMESGYESSERSSSSPVSLELSLADRLGPAHSPDWLPAVATTPLHTATTQLRNTVFY